MTAAAPRAERLAWLAAQDAALAAELGTPGPNDDAAVGLDGIYAARDALTTALVTAGPGGAGVRRALRLAIADDLRAVELISAR